MSSKVDASDGPEDVSHQNSDEDPEDLSQIPIETVKTIQRLTEVVQQHRMNYRAFEKLITHLRRSGLHRRLAMTRRYMYANLALSETMWLDWFEDEQGSAVHDKGEPAQILRLSLMDHPYSTVLWDAYVEHMSKVVGNSSSGSAAQMVSRDVIQRSDRLHLQSLRLEALSALKHEFYKSREYWKKYQEICQKSLESGDLDIGSYFGVFLDQLKRPHAGLEDTFSDYSKAVTDLDNDNYEAHLIEGNKIFQMTRRMTDARSEQESHLRDSNFSLQACQHYAAWLLQSGKECQHDIEEVIILLTQVALRQSPSPSLWLSMYNFLSKSDFDAQFINDRLDLAIRHCPNDGRLWSCRIRTIARCTHDLGQVLEACEMALTNFESLEQSVDIINIIQSTFLCLRTIADDLDLGTSPYLEFIELMSKEYEHMQDPFFTIPKLLINVQTTSGQGSQARVTWKLAAKRHSHRALFWLQYMQWEIDAGEYSLARNVIKTACLKTTDAPQIVFDAAEVFEIEYGDLMNYDKTCAVIAKATQNYITTQTLMQQENSTNIEPIQEEDSRVSTKHKLHDTDTSDNEKCKRARLTEKHDNSSPPERHREITTVFVRNLEAGVEESTIRSFFDDCGKIRSVEYFKDKLLALVEFENVDDSRAALTKTLKHIGGRTVTVESARDTVLFISNPPPAFLEEDISIFFSKYGTVLQVRMPSLRFDQTRRFAYVQMSSREEAMAALKSHGTQLDNYTLSVAIANPQEAKRGKGNAAVEQREIFVKGLSWKATQADIEHRFREYGSVQSIRVPQTLSKDHHDGIAFIVYEESAGALRALEADRTSYYERVIEVSVAESRSRARVPTQIAQRQEHRRQTRSDGHGRPSAGEIGAKTLGIMNLADTVTEAQLRAIFVPFGTLRKVVLRPDLAGAIVEYDDPADAGTASLALSGREIGHKTIQIGRYEDLMQRKATQTGTKRATGNLSLAPRQTRTAQARRRLDLRHGPSPIKKDDPDALQQEQPASDSGQQDKGKKQDFFRALMHHDSTKS